MPDALNRAIALAAGASSVDWNALEREASGADERARLEDLRGLLEGDAHSRPPQPMDDTVGLPAPPNVGSQRQWGHLTLL
jgi:hypothetical protein